jgi:hypothetical protein
LAVTHADQKRIINAGKPTVVCEARSQVSKLIYTSLLLHEKCAIHILNKTVCRIQRLDTTKKSKHHDSLQKRSISLATLLGQQVEMVLEIIVAIS